MKRKTAIIMLLLAVALSVAAQMRQHRSIWWSPYLGEWPGQEITERNYSSMERRLQTSLDRIAKANINVVYYHVRSTCDANYNSAYEPWSANVSSERGVAPYGDPLEMMVREAHLRGIEVYAWVNPYRYCNSLTPNQGSHPLNYENSHPDWLLSAVDQTILNPALPEVMQRIADVCADIATKYDIDGIVFDDYFYTKKTPMTADASFYDSYKNAGGTLSQADWRRDNVNRMVALVNKTIKGIKPYLSFGISPAGVANHPESVYPELPAPPSAGYQYDGIYSDPVAWLKEKTIDFISPQIYWPTTASYRELSDWWSLAADHFGRHSYTSVYMNDIVTLKTQEYIDQIEYNRAVSPEDQSGIVFFSFGKFIDYRESYNGDNIDNFYNILGKYVYPTVALNPLQHWKGPRNPMAVRNLRKDGSVLTWDPDDNMRYVVYSVPASVGEPSAYLANSEYIKAVVYANSYAIPEGEETNNFAVAAYDRYGNLYTPYILGAGEKAPVAPELLNPADNDYVTLFGQLGWKAPAGAVTVMFAYDPEMKDVFFSRTGDISSLNLTDVPSFDYAKKVYWQVISLAPNAPEAKSEIRSFNIRQLNVVPPETPASLTPEITWTNLGPDVEYHLELSYSEKFTTVDFDATTMGTSVKVPENILSAYTTYYLRVTASRGNVDVRSQPVSFRTLEMTFDSAPEFINPDKDGATVHSDSKISVKPVLGAVNHIIQLSASSTFPSRSTTNIRGTESDVASELKVSSKLLENGKTYYLRAYATYNNSEGTSRKTPYSEVLSFVYSSQAGVNDVPQDNSQIAVDGNTVTLPDVRTIRVYDTNGVLRLCETGRVIKLDLPSGIYILRSENSTLKITL